nr:DVU3141 family protein [uncultured Halomonas sp.]
MTLNYAPSRGRAMTGLRLAFASLCLVALAGCAAQGSMGNGAQNIASMRGGTTVDSSLSQFLETASPGRVIQLQQSPWGSNVEVTAEERYYAASGRICVHLRVMRPASAALPQAQLACRDENQGWFTQRLVTKALERDSLGLP